MLFFPLSKCTDYAEESAHYARMLRQKSLLLEMVSGSFGTDYSGNYASILDASLDQRREDMTSCRSDS